MYCSAPACSSTPLRPSVHSPSISLVVYIMCIQTLCDHLNVLYFSTRQDLHRFEVRLELYGANARLVVSPPSLSPSHPPTPHRQADGQLSPLYPPSPSFSSFGTACVELCCLPPPSLVRNARLCFLVYVRNVEIYRSFCPEHGRLNRPSYLRTQWMRPQRRSQFEHDHRRKADRAPQITPSFTQDRRLAHWHI